MKLMKGISIFAIIGFLGLATTSCLKDDNEYTDYGHFATTNIEVIEDSIKPVNEVTKIYLTYQKTNTCQSFIQIRQFDGSKEFSPNFGIFGSIRFGNSCEQKMTTEKVTMDFRPRKAGKYSLKFWTGNIPYTNTPTFDSIQLEIKDK